MLDNDEILAFEVGVRVTQVFSLLSSSEFVSTVEIEAALLRLESSIARLRSQLKIQTCRLSGVVDTSLTAWMSRQACIVPESQAEEIRVRIDSARTSLEDEIRRHHPREGQWFRLGIVIADGIDECWSDGVPRMVPGLYPHTDPAGQRVEYSRITFFDPVPPNWTWRFPEEVDELVVQLGHSLDHFFPQGRALAGEECGLFTELDFKRYWGWHAIEFALKSFSQVTLIPRWDSEHRTLYLGNQVIHHYENPAKSQIPLLEAFEEANWRNPVRCPFSDGKKANQSITDLNRTFGRSKLRFHGGVQGMNWKLESISDPV